jgi:cellulose synthase/poly-beta-1,6-N-acetylglucosamine synthase-like glycosyltransferase
MRESSEGSKGERRLGPTGVGTAPIRVCHMIGWLMVLGGGALLVYTFAGYPLLLAAAAAFRRPPRPERARPESRRNPLPRISITVPVHNEAHQIQELLASLAALEYPEDRRQILIVSDASTDGTDEVVRQWADRGIELFRVAGRGGKGAAENAARKHLTGDIVVNTDASIRIPPRSLEPLVRPFDDPSVGVASGRDLSVSARGVDADPNTGEAGYVGYEMMVRDLETRLGGIVGASGCFYATRRELHNVEIPPELNRDFAAALVARERGYRSVSVPEAVCRVPRAASLAREYRRKVRTAARGMTTLWAWRHLMNPLRHPTFAWKLVSHKMCRWLVPVALLMLAGGLAVLAPWHAWAGGTLALGVAGVLVGGLGWWWGARGWTLPGGMAGPAYFLMSNVAVLHALARATAGGGSERLWEPTRRERAASGTRAGHG